MTFSRDTDPLGLSSSSGSPLGQVGPLPVFSSREQEERQRVIDSPISAVRVKAFREDYLKSRQAIGATEKIFRWCGAFQPERDTKEEAAFGFNRLVSKGPLVEGSNWGDLGGWDFAVAQERYLLGRLQEELSTGVGQTGQTLPEAFARDANGIMHAAASLSARLAEVGFEPSVIVLAADLGGELLIKLEEKVTVQGWQLPEELRTNWILGKYEKQPVLYIGNASLSEVYAVDVRSFATLVQFEPVVDLRFNAIDEAAAQRLLRDKPDLHIGTNELMTRAQLLLYQSYEFRIHNRQAVYSANIMRHP